MMIAVVATANLFATCTFRSNIFSIYVTYVSYLLFILFLNPFLLFSFVRKWCALKVVVASLSNVIVAWGA